MSNPFITTETPIEKPAETPASPVIPAAIETPPQAPAGSRFASELSWLGAGFVMPIFSVDFYRRVMRRRFIWAFWFFVLLALTLTVLGVLRMSSSMRSAGAAIQQIYTNGTMPEITISNGVAVVEGKQPNVLYDTPQMWVALDTTGYYTEIDESRHAEGLLMTRTTLHMLNNGRYQVYPLSQLNATFQANPLVIDQAGVMRVWNSLTNLFAVLSLFALLLWNFAVRLGYMALLSLVVWLLVGVLRPGTPYRQVLAAGVYAFVPALLVSYLLDRLDVSFFAMQTAVWLAFWLVMLALVFNRVQRESLPFLMGLLALPMLVVFALDYVMTWNNGALILTAVLVVTLIVLLVVNLIEGQSGPEESPQG